MQYHRCVCQQCFRQKTPRLLVPLRGNQSDHHQNFYISSIVTIAIYKYKQL